MASDNRVGLYDHRDRIPLAPQTPQPDPEESIGWRQFEPFTCLPVDPSRFTSYRICGFVSWF